MWVPIQTTALADGLEGQAGGPSHGTPNLPAGKSEGEHGTNRPGKCIARQRSGVEPRCFSSFIPTQMAYELDKSIDLRVDAPSFLPVRGPRGAGRNGCSTVPWSTGASGQCSVATLDPSALQYSLNCWVSARAVSSSLVVLHERDDSPLVLGSVQMDKVRPIRTTIDKQDVLDTLDRGRCCIVLGTGHVFSWERLRRMERALGVRTSCMTKSPERGNRRLPPLQCPSPRVRAFAPRAPHMAGFPTTRRLTLWSRTFFGCEEGRRRV